MQKFKAAGAVIQREPDVASQALKATKVEKMRKLAKTLKEMEDKRAAENRKGKCRKFGPVTLEQMSDFSLAEFCRFVGLDKIRARDNSDDFDFDPKINSGAERVAWIGNQPEHQTFWAGGSHQALILQCFDPKDTSESPIKFSAYLNAGRLESLGGFVNTANGSYLKGFTASEFLLQQIAALLDDGWDPMIEIPSPQHLATNGIAPLGLFNGFLMSHLRISECTIVLMGIGDREWADKKKGAKDQEVIKEWVEICKAMVRITKSTIPGLKPFRFLIVDAEQSEAVKQIMEEFTDIPVLKCPTGDEFRQQNPTESDPKISKKDGKKKQGA